MAMTARNRLVVPTAKNTTEMKPYREACSGKEAENTDITLVLI
jgi:hypothetical protein